MRYFIQLSYDGSDFAGWQRQPNVSTVQGAIEKAFKILFKKDIPILGCGRTDKGVHASYFIAHCDLDISEDQHDEVVYKLNQLTPRSIACQKLIKVAHKAHARFEAISRSYQYHIHIYKNPFLGPYSTYFPNGKKLKLELLDEVAEQILELSDFTSFCKLHGASLTNICQVTESYWKTDVTNGVLLYQVSANRFLRGMVRLIVGSSLNIALGKLSMSELKKHISLGTRSSHMSSAPAEGLVLMDVKYPFISRD